MKGLDLLGLVASLLFAIGFTAAAVGFGIWRSPAASSAPAVSPFSSAPTATASTSILCPEVSRLRLLLAMHNSSDFERVNHMHSRFGDCKDKGDTMWCSAFTEFSAPVTYHCDFEACAVDCGVVK